MKKGKDEGHVMGGGVDFNQVVLAALVVLVVVVTSGSYYSGM